MNKSRMPLAATTPAAPEKSVHRNYTINPNKSKGEIHRKPIKIARQPANLPEALKQLDQWCLSGLNKEPLNTRGYRVDVTNPANLASFQAATVAIDQVTCAGVGFVLTAADNIIVVDVDHCVTESGEFSDVAKELLEMVPTYVELSQSRTGLHFIFSDSDIPVGFTGRKGCIEIYSSQRYFALTGWKLADRPNDITPLTGMTKQLLGAYFPVADFSVSNSTEQYDYTPLRSDATVLQSLQYNQKFQRLFYQGDISNYPSQSEADGALMLMLADATILNAAQMRQLFSQSALGQRDKWVQRSWYQDYLVSGAINFAVANHHKCAAVFLLVTFTESSQITNELFAAAATCKNDPGLYNYYENFRCYWKTNKTKLGVNMEMFRSWLKTAEDKLAAEQLHRHNQQIDEMEQLTLPAPYDTINWVIPEGYKVNAKGTWVMMRDGYKKICESAIFITQEIAHHSTGIIKNQLYVYTVGKGWKHFDWVDTKVLNNSSLMSLELASLIPTINSVNCNHLVSYLTQFRVANHHNIQQLTSTNNIGWVDGEFVTPYTSNQYVLETTANTLAQALQLKGTFDDWRQVAAKVWNYSSISRFIMTMGFAPVLLNPLKTRNFCLYLWAKSMLGKTTMFSLVSSIWGTTDTMVNLGGTLNGFEGGAAERDGFVYIIDEKQQVRDNFDATKLIMKLANGRGDARANKDGTLRPVKTWKTIGLLNGEEPLLDDWSTNGAFTRSITLHATEKIIPDELTAAIWNEVIDENCGWAGKLFVEALQSVDFHQLKQQKWELYRQLKQEFPNHHDEHIQYVALAAVTEQLVNQYIFQQPDSSLQTARDILSQLDVKATIDNAETEWEHLVSWVSQESKHFVDKSTGAIPSDPCYGEYKADCLVITKSVLEEEFERWSNGRLKINKVLSDLYSAGYIIGYQRTDKDIVSKTWKVSLNGIKNIPAIKISRSLLMDQ